MNGSNSGAVTLYSEETQIHRLDSDTGNHYQLSFDAIQWVTDMHICNAACPALLATLASGLESKLWMSRELGYKSQKL